MEKQSMEAYAIIAMLVNLTLVLLRTHSQAVLLLVFLGTLHSQVVTIEVTLSTGCIRF